MEQPLRTAIKGALKQDVPNRRPKFNEINWPKTIRINLKHYQPEYKTIIPHQLIGFGRKGQALKEIILCVDQSGSMAASIVYSSIFASVLASMTALKTHMIIFDTSVVDLTKEMNDPVDLLFGTQLGGGTEYINCKPLGNKKIWAREGWLKYETTNEGDGRSTEIEWYVSGQKKSSVPYKNGQQYGRVKRWYETGQKEEDVMMKNTRVHGSYRSWYSNGNKQRVFFSINNVMSGEYKEWTEDGKLLWEITEMDNERKIEVKNYWPNGQVKMSGKSDMPESLSIHQWSQTRHGYWTYWYKDNTVSKSEKYADGQLLTVEIP